MSNLVPQWFIITVIGGKEDSIIETIKEKIHNFGYEEFVKEIKVFKQQKNKEEIFAKDHPSLPKTFKNTKTTKWETTPDGKYKKTKIKSVNKFPGYIFINMIMDSMIWYTIRNTNGVMGFVGSSGKGAIPIPITISEFESITSENKLQETSSETVSSKQIKSDEPKQKVTYETTLKPGDTVKITSGALENTIGNVKSIDINKGVASIEAEIFGRLTTIEVSFSELKIE